MGGLFYELVITYRVRREPTVIIYYDRDTAVADARKGRADPMSANFYESVRLYKKEEVDLSADAEPR